MRNISVALLLELFFCILLFSPCFKVLGNSYEGLKHSLGLKDDAGEMHGEIDINYDGQGGVRCYGMERSGLCHYGDVFCPYYRTPEMIVENRKKTIKRTEARRVRDQDRIQREAEKMAKKIVRTSQEKKQ